MIRFHLEKTVHSDLEKAFQIFTDIKSHPDFFPEYFPSIRIKSARDNVCVAEEHMVLGTQEFVMMVKHTFNFPTRHEIVVLGGDCKGTRIVETFEKNGSETSLKVEAQFKIAGISGLRNIIHKNEIKDNFSSLIDKISKIAES